MKKVYEITEEEFEAIKEAIEETLTLWQYDWVSAYLFEKEGMGGAGGSISMSKEEFFKQLKRNFRIIDK